MVDEAEFFERVKKTIEISQRLQKLFDKGKLDNAAHARHTESLNRMLATLKTDHLALIDQTISEIDKAQERTDADKIRGILRDDEYYAVKNRLSQLKNELESDKDAITLTSGQEHITFLQGLLDEKKYERYGPPKISPKSIVAGRRYRKEELDYKKYDGPATSIDNPMPFWVMGTAGFLILAAFVIGATISLRGLVFILPTATAIIIGAIAVIVHLSSHLAGIEAASVSRAFKCAMMYIILCAIWACIMGFTTSFMFASVNGQNLLDVRAVPLTLQLILLATAVFVCLLIPVWCYHAVYDATIRQAVLAAIIQFVIFFFLANVVSWYLASILFSPDMFSAPLNETHRLKIDQ